MLRTLVSHLLLGRNEFVLMDMEAGIEHLGRATAQAVDRLIVVVEPGRRSLEVAGRIRQLAADIGLTKIGWVGNKVRSPQDRDFLSTGMKDIPSLGSLSYDPRVVQADLDGRPPYDGNPDFVREMSVIVDHVLS